MSNVVAFPEHRIDGPDFTPQVQLRGGGTDYSVAVWRWPSQPRSVWQGSICSECVRMGLQHLRPGLVITDLTRDAAAAAARRKARRC